MPSSSTSALLTSNADTTAKEASDTREHSDITKEQGDISITEGRGISMHILIINFSLEGIDEEQYSEQVESVAPAYASLLGLVSKTWLANQETNTYGGVYVWQDREAMENYLQTEIFKGMVDNPYLGEVTARDFAVLEGPTQVTRGMAEATSTTGA
jgi:quinol monooxygenase YgiN